MDNYSKHYNTIVIGIGMGSVTVYELAKHCHGVNPAPIIWKTR